MGTFMLCWLPFFLWTIEERVKTAKGWIGQRYVLAVMLLVGLVNIFAMRVCLNVAIVRMAAPPPSTNIKDGTCPPPRSSANYTRASDIYEFSWTQPQQGLVLSSFYWGYVFSHLPGGYIADRFGGKYTMLLGILSTAVTTLLTPFSARQGDWPALVFIRVVMGLGEGVTYPALSVLLAKWAPPNELSRIGTFVFAGAQLGIVAGTALSGFLLQTFIWDFTFYFYGSLGIVWCILWQLLCFSTPDDHPFISEKEHKYLAESIKPNKNVAPVPWRAILTSLPVWALIVGHIGHDWGLITMVTDLPKYMSDVLHFPIKQNGLLSALPYLVMWICSNILGFISDWIIATNRWSVLFVRKFMTCIASIIPAAGILAASYAGCDHNLVVTLFTVGMAGMAGFYPGMRCNLLDITKNYAGTVMAVVNGIGVLSGIFAPTIIGFIATEGTLYEWRIVFYMTFACLIITNFFYISTAKADVQPWDIQESDKNDKNASKDNSIALNVPVPQVIDSKM